MGIYEKRMETSIIIRAKNEEKWIGKVLKKLFNQTYKDFEIIIVDSGSTDRTLEIASKFPVKIFHLKPEEFTYPRALNFGCEKAVGKKYFILLSAHSLPISDTWLRDGLENFSEGKILGVYGSMRALPDASISEKIYFNIFTRIISNIIRKYTVKVARMGVMGFTNAIVRRDLWEKHNFDEHYALGGEDMAWAKYWFEKGYFAVMDIKFTVYHSHGLGFINFIRQWIHWASIKNPQPFKKLEYRN